MAKNESEQARELAEEAIEAGTSGDITKAERLVNQAKKIDKNTVDEVAKEIDEEREQAQHYEQKK